MADFLKLKRENRLEELVEELGFTLEAGERYWTCRQDPELVVDVEKQVYYWPSKDERGSVIDWVIARLDWPFEKAVNYLTNRPNMAEADRPHWPRVAETADHNGKKPLGESQVVDRKAIPAGMVHDERLTMARWLGKDFPSGIDRLLGFSLVRLLDETRWIPRLFLPIHGLIHEAGEFCCYCYSDLPKYSSGGAYLSIQVGPDYELVKDSGVYCRRCVNSFEAWLKALDLVKDLISEQKTPADAVLEVGSSEKIRAD